MIKEYKQYEQNELIPQPKLLDIVKIEDRWAQVLGTGGSIKFLDDSSSRFINWDEYKLIRTFKPSALYNLIEQDDKLLTANEIKNIHWGAEDAKKPKLKLQVTVFGEYMKK